MKLTSTIRCPECGATKEEVMPTDACQFFYRCTSCDALLRPLGQDCCVFCSYGDTPCPPMQQATCSGEHAPQAWLEQPESTRIHLS